MHDVRNDDMITDEASAAAGLCLTMFIADSGCQPCPSTIDVQPKCDAVKRHLSCCGSPKTITKHVQVPAKPACKEIHSR